MSSKVIPFGYSVPGAMEYLDNLLQDENAILVDIRQSTKSKKKSEWTLEKLQERYGNRYLWIQALGNLNYFKPGAPIVINNLEVGLTRLIIGLQRGYTLVLLCTCQRYETCHRKVIVDALLAKMSDVEVVQPGVYVPAGMSACISIQQPFAWIIMHGDLLEANGIPRKEIENRSWTTEFRTGKDTGKLLLRAGNYDGDYFEGKRLSEYSRYLFERLIGHELAYRLYDLMPKFKVEYPSGGIVGQCDLTGVLSEYLWRDPDWKVDGQYGLQLANVESLPFVKVAGAFKLFFVPSSLVEQEEEAKI